MVLRRASILIPASVLLAITVVAVARTVRHTSGTDWSAGTFVNTDARGGELALTTVDQTTGTWYRSVWDGADFALQLDKDDDDPFATSDTCLELADQAWTSAITETVRVDGTDFRVGPHYDGAGAVDVLATLAEDTTIELVDGVDGVPVQALRLLTLGSVGPGATTEAYAVTFTYVDACASAADTVTVPVAVAAADGRRVPTAGPHWSTVPWTDPVGASTCGGVGGADVLTVEPPTPCDVASVYLDYPSAAESRTSWLSGPVALTAVTDEAGYGALFTYTGEYLSPELDGGDDTTSKIWSELT